MCLPNSSLNLPPYDKVPPLDELYRYVWHQKKGDGFELFWSKIGNRFSPFWSKVLKSVWIQETRSENVCEFYEVRSEKDLGKLHSLVRNRVRVWRPSCTPPPKILISTLLPNLDVFKIRSSALSLRTGFPGALRRGGASECAREACSLAIQPSIGVRFVFSIMLYPI